MKIGNKIKKARKAKGLNQTQLAGKLHISRGTMSRIENDKTSVSEDFVLKTIKPQFLKICLQIYM